MRIYCGQVGGSSENNCIISRGSLGLASMPGIFDFDSYNNGVLIQGVTFEDAADVAVFIAFAGSFQFIDCIFRVSLTRLSLLNLVHLSLISLYSSMR